MGKLSFSYHAGYFNGRMLRSHRGGEGSIPSLVIVCNVGGNERR